jgi:polysaccharide deacetylase family protein (PEP-CTERM system associated)
MINVLTVDVEEYFHPTEIQQLVPSHQWEMLPSRIEGEISDILDLFDSKGVKATFFVLGWVAQRRPKVVRQIADRGHEIACHSFAHSLVYDLTPEQFRRDTERAVAVIEDACGVTPRAYRAPSYSITLESMWALEILVECGFHCDSSIYPITHDRYGVPGSDRHMHILQTPSGPIKEIPIATVELSKGRIAPIGGGGYLRMLPYRYTSAGICRMNRDEQQPACIYFHPWEIDPQQPRLTSALVPRLRTYTGLRGMRRKLERLITDFQFSTLSKVHGEAEIAMAVGSSLGARPGSASVLAAAIGSAG